jgi:hypothetical protein
MEKFCDDMLDLPLGVELEHWRLKLMETHEESVASYRSSL